jgi:hypothetical protein
VTTMAAAQATNRTTESVAFDVAATIPSNSVPLLSYCAAW